MATARPDFLLDFDADAAADAEAGDGLYGLPHGPERSAIVVIPVPFEATASFHKGTAAAPAAVLEASWQVDLFDLEYGDPWVPGIAMQPADPVFADLEAAAEDAVARGDVADVDRIGSLVNQRVQQHTAALFDAGRIPAVLGGDHSVPYGAITEAAARHPGLGLLHIDAHADLRVAYEGYRWSHASIIHNVLEAEEHIGPVVQIGIRDLGRAEWDRICGEPRLSCLTDPALGRALSAGQTFDSVIAEALAPLPATIWITWDIDGLDPSLCPNTGTPVPGGLGWGEALGILAAVADSGRRIVGFDLCEVGAQPWDANVGARLLYKLAGATLRSQ